MTSRDMDSLLALLRSHGLTVTAATAAELTSLGIPIPPQTKTISDDPADAIVLVCMEAHSGEPLIMPDNETAPCGWRCGRTIQHRPHVPAKAQKVCVSCASERGTLQ